MGTRRNYIVTLTVLNITIGFHLCILSEVTGGLSPLCEEDNSLLPDCGAGTPSELQVHLNHLEEDSQEEHLSGHRQEGGGFLPVSSE